MSLLERIQGASIRVTRWLALLAVAAILGGAVLTVADVTLRSTVRVPIFGANDIVLLIAVVAVSACFPHGVAMREHMRLAAFGQWAGGRTGHWLCEIFAGLVTALAFAGFAWQFGRKSMSLAANHEISQLLALPVAPWWWVATALMALATLAQVIVVLCDVESLVAGREPAVEEAPVP